MISYRMSFATGTNVTILVIFWLISYATRNPHLFQRSGALVAALGALIVVLQLLDEMKFDELRSKMVRAGQEEQKKSDHLVGLQETESRLRQKIYSKRADELRQKRIATAIAASVCVFFGELVHGYGDLIVPASILAQ